jgi:hypothetical protein
MDDHPDENKSGRTREANDTWVRRDGNICYLAATLASRVTRMRDKTCEGIEPQERRRIARRGKDPGDSTRLRQLGSG